MNKMMTMIGMGIVLISTAAKPQFALATKIDIELKKDSLDKNTTKDNQMHILKFEEIADMANHVCSNLPKKQWIGILAITRGGLFPAGIISQSLDIRRIEVINVKSYDEKSQGQLEILNNPNVLNDGENWLVIDDLSDSGKTLMAVKNLYPKAFYATLMIKPNGKGAVDLYAKEFPQDLWIHFPWEPLKKE